MQIGWPIATRPAVEHGSGQQSSFSTCWTWPFSTVTSFYLHVVGRKSHRDFRLTLIREMLARSGHEPRPSMPVGRPAAASNNTGIPDIRHNKHWPGRSNTKQRCRMCSVGVWSERWYSDVSSVTWRFVLIENVLKITLQRPTCKTSIRPSSIQTAETSIAM